MGGVASNRGRVRSVCGMRGRRRYQGCAAGLRSMGALKAPAVATTCASQFGDVGVHFTTGFFTGGAVCSQAKMARRSSSFSPA